MSSKIKVDTIENIAGSGNVSLGSGHNLVVPGNITGQGTTTLTGNLTVDTNTLHVNASNNRVGVGTTSPADHLSVVTSGANAQLSVDRSDGASGRTVLIHSSTGGQLQTTGSVPLIFGTADIEKMRIDALGRVTKPLQPSFSARGQDANWRTIPGPSVWCTIAGTNYSNTSGNYQMGTNFTTSSHYGAEDIGNHFTEASGHFTAPIAGHYYFMIRMYLNRTNSNSPGIYLNPRINSIQTDGGGAGVQGSYHFERTTMSASSNAYIPFGRHDVYYMAANDTFTYALNAEAAGFQIYGSYTEFKGYLIG